MFYAKPNPEWMRVVSTAAIPSLEDGTVATTGMYILNGSVGYNTDIKIANSGPIGAFGSDGMATVSMRGDAGNGVVYRYLVEGQLIRASTSGATMSLLA